MPHGKQPKRNRHSPDIANSNNKKVNMGEKGDLDQQSLAILLARFDKQDLEMGGKLDALEKSSLTLQTAVEKITRDMASISNDLNKTTKAVEIVEKDVDKLKIDVADVQTIKHKLEQELLKCDVTIFGIPDGYHNKTDDLIDTFNRTLEMSLNQNSFARINTFNRRNSQCMARLSFYDIKEKNIFMKRVDQLSRDNEGKRHPLVVEDFFEEVANPPSELCGKLLSISNTLTKHNQELIKMKKSIRPAILFEREGRILIKKDFTSRTFEMNSVDQIKQFVSECRNK